MLTSLARPNANPLVSIRYKALVTLDNGSSGYEQPTCTILLASVQDESEIIRGDDLQCKGDWAANDIIMKLHILQSLNCWTRSILRLNVSVRRVINSFNLCIYGGSTTYR
jgi:hypothetical protein